MLFRSKAVYDVLGSENVEKAKVEFAIGQGYYCEVKMQQKLTGDMVGRIGERMRTLAQMNLPITKKSYSLDDARAIFKKYKMLDKEKLFRYRRSSFVNVYCLDGFYDYYYGYMLPSTGYVKYFDLTHYEDGILLLLPGMGEPDKIDYF